MLPTLVSIPETERDTLNPQEAMTLTASVISEQYKPCHMTADKLENELSFLTLPGNTHSFFMEVLIKRLKYAGADLEYSSLTVGFLALISKNVASAVMWAYTLVEETKANGIVSIARLTQLFPTGFPTEEGLLEYWDAQKLNPRQVGMFGWKTDNKLDLPETWGQETSAVAEFAE